MPCKNTGRFFGLWTFSAGDFSAFSSSIRSCHCFVCVESSHHQLPALCVRSSQMAKFGIAFPGEQPCLHHHSAFPLGNRWDRMGSKQQAANWTMLRTPKKKKKFPSPFPSLTLNLQFSFCAIFKSKIFLVEKRLCVIHFASFCHSKQHSKIKGVLGIGAVRCHHLSSQCAGTMQCLGWILSEERPRHSFQYSQCTTQYLRQTLISKELSKNIDFFCLLCPSWVMTGLLCSLKMRWKDSK